LWQGEGQKATQRFLARSPNVSVVAQQGFGLQPPKAASDHQNLLPAKGLFFAIRSAQILFRTLYA